MLKAISRLKSAQVDSSRLRAGPGADRGRHRNRLRSRLSYSPNRLGAGPEPAPKRLRTGS